MRKKNFKFQALIGYIYVEESFSIETCGAVLNFYDSRKCIECKKCKRCDKCNSCTECGLCNRCGKCNKSKGRSYAEIIINIEKNFIDPDEEIKKTGSKTNAEVDAESQARYEAHEKIRKIMIALRTFMNASSYCSIVIMDDNNSSMEFENGSYFQLGEILPESRDKLSDHINYVVNLEEEDQLYLAMHYYSNAMNRTHPIDSIIDLCTSIEALGGGWCLKTGELSSLGAFTVTGEEERIKVYDELRILFFIRGEIVHGKPESKLSKLAVSRKYVYNKKMSEKLEGWFGLVLRIIGHYRKYEETLKCEKHIIAVKDHSKTLNKKYETKILNKRFYGEE